VATTVPLVTCGGRPFPAAVLSGPRGAELGTDPAARRLRAQILREPVAGPESLPRAGWIRAIDDPDGVLFVAWALPPTGEEPLWTLWIAPGEAEGPAVEGWDVWAAGRCWPQVVLPDGLQAAGWVPEAPVGAGDTTFVALVTERDCNSGEPATGRVVDPVIVIGPDRVAITFGIRPRPGDHECQGNPPTPTEVVLPEPLGGRMLVDGSFVPPRVVQAPPPEG
jgi:hypothetical protein